MSKKIASTKQTSGGGFTFEDKTAAWFLAHFLSDQYPFSHDIGKLERIDFQTRQDGWLLDDFLLTCRNSENSFIKIAVSVKSNTQFNTKGIQQDLVNDLWTQYLNDRGNVFDQQNDYLLVVNAELPAGISKDLNVLLNAAQHVDTNTLHQRLIATDKTGFSKRQKALFESFRCPSNLAQQYNVQDNQIGEFLSRIILLNFDFEDIHSMSENRIIEICRNCLDNLNNKQEVLLFQTLCSLRKEIAPSGGSIDYDKLIGKLRGYFPLKGFSNHAADWKNIHVGTVSKLNSIPERIGNKINLKRQDELIKLAEIITNNKVTVVHGKSGYGKSVLVKKYLEHFVFPQKKAIWIDPQIVEHGSFARHFNLSHSITELMAKQQDSICYLIIDGVDRFFKQEQMGRLFEILSSALNPMSPWRIVFTCQTDDLNDVIEKLYRTNISIEHAEYVVRAITEVAFDQIQQEFPQLTELFKHNHLKEILANLKYLDLLAFNTTQNLPSTDDNPLGESNIIDWIWKEAILSRETNGDQSSRFLQVISEKQADSLIVGIPTSAFDIAELAPLPQLKNDKIITEIEDRLYFNHDLFGDWARYKLIRGNSPDLKAFILGKNLLSPLWCKAVRLIGVHLLESNKDASNWVHLFSSLDENIPKEKILQDLLLEAIIFSSSTLTHLESLWELLKENEGDILRRFFDRFLVKATVPNPLVLKIAKDVGKLTLSEASTIDRYPNYLYWPDVIRFIDKHVLEMIPICCKKIAIITGCWLQKTPENFLYRRESAGIALKNANWMFDFKLKGGLAMEEVDEEVYKAFLAGGAELTEKVVNLSLKLCRRSTFAHNDQHHTDYNSQNVHSAAIRSWSGGPYEPVDDAFATVCMNNYGLSSLMKIAPEKAKEIILALSINPPAKKISFYEPMRDTLDLSEYNSWFPPFYNRGPFLQFLKANPKAGLDVIITLVNFATERWADRPKYKGTTVNPIILTIEDKSLEFIGDYSIYYWYRDVGNAPHLLVSALMALEKFLIDEIDNKKNIDAYLEFILRKGSSIALIGVLSSVGKYSPDLYLTTLKPLLSEYTFYDWEKDLDYGAFNIEGHQMIGSELFDSTTARLAKDWSNLRHRKISISSVVRLLILTKKEMQLFFESVISSWKKSLNAIESEGHICIYLNDLISQLDHKNYSEQIHEGKSYLVYNEPQELSSKLKELREEKTSNWESTIFAFKFYQDIEKNTDYTLSELESVWEKVQNISISEEDDPYDLVSGEYQNVFAGCAILIHHRSKWIEKHPDYLENILKLTEQALKNYQITISSLTEVEIGHSWMAFVCRFLPSIWLEEINNERIRALIVQSIIKSSYSTAKILFTNISNFFSWSDPYFIQAQNLLVMWSSALHKFEIAQLKSRLHIDKNAEEIINNYIEEISIEFVQGKTAVTPIAWSKVRNNLNEAEKQFWNTLSSNHGRSFNYHGLDTELIYHAFFSIPKLSSKLNKNEFDRIMSFWVEVIDQIKFDFQDSYYYDEEQGHYPGESDRWVLGNLSDLVLIVPESDRHFFWKPILEHGINAKHWVQIFCQDFYFVNMDHPENYDSFLKEWDKLYFFACSASSWKHSFKYWESDELWYSLMGLSDPHLRVWQGDYCLFLEKMAERILTWIGKRFYNQEVILRLIILLGTTSGKVILAKGIIIINAHLLQHIEAKRQGAPEGYTLKNFEHNDRLARLLSEIWEKDRNTITSQENVFTAFKEIVTYLVSIQNAIGLELQQKLLQ